MLVLLCPLLTLSELRRVFDWLCCSRPEVDSHRFLETLRQAVDKGACDSCCAAAGALTRLRLAGELKSSKKFEQWAKQVARKPAPANPLELHRCSGCSLPLRLAVCMSDARLCRSSADAGGSDASHVRAPSVKHIARLAAFALSPSHACLLPSQALVAAIRGRAQQGGSFLDALAAKHGGAAGKRSSKRDEPSEDEFAAAQARMKSRR